MAHWLTKLIDDQESSAICLETVPVSFYPVGYARLNSCLYV